MAAACAHAFFNGMHGDELYTQTPPTLAGGAAAPQPHASWARRQNSIMWSPLPQRYAFGEDTLEGLEPIAETPAEAPAPFTRPLAGLRSGTAPPMGPPTPRPAALVEVDDPEDEGGSGWGDGSAPQPLRALPMDLS